jgi:hypothetical protein
MTADEINGQWFVMQNDKPIAGPFRDNGQAWRWIDQHSEELAFDAEHRKNARNMYDGNDGDHGAL